MHDLEILKYLQKQGPANTFRLARKLGIDRHQLLNVIERLEAKGAVTVRSGIVQFLRFLPEEKKEAPPKISKPRENRPSAKPKVLQTLQSENELLKEKLTELKETIQELEQRASVHPKTITRTVTKTVIKEVPVIKTVIKKIPVTQPPFTTELWQKLRSQPQKLKIPMSKLLEGIQQLKKPEFVK